jgi:hypothetical protein
LVALRQVCERLRPADFLSDRQFVSAEEARAFQAQLASQALSPGTRFRAPNLSGDVMPSEPHPSFYTLRTNGDNQATLYATPDDDPWQAVIGPENRIAC